MGYSTYKINNNSLVIYKDNKGKREWAGYYPKGTEIGKIDIVNKWGATWLYGKVLKDNKIGYFDISYLKGAQLEKEPDNVDLLGVSKNIIQAEIDKINPMIAKAKGDKAYSKYLNKVKFAFIAARKRLNKIKPFTPPEEPNEVYSFENTLKLGDSGAGVVNLQKLLIKWHMVAYLGGAGADGNYGYGTKEAVEEFQKGMSLNVTGIADENTWTLLNEKAIDMSRWLTPQVSDNPEDNGRLPFECNCNNKYCDSRTNAQPPKLSVGLLILIERIQIEINRRYDRTDIVVLLTDDMDKRDHDDRNGGNRCQKWNDSHGGAPNSKHTKNCAADLFFCCPYQSGKKCPTIHNIWEVADELNPYGGVGKYGYNIHIDTDGRRRW